MGEFVWKYGASGADERMGVVGVFDCCFFVASEGAERGCALRGERRFVLLHSAARWIVGI